MAEASREVYKKLLKRTDVVDSKQPSTGAERSDRDVEARDADKAGYYELLRKAQRSRENTSFKG
jgi:hypothetical protein